VPPGVLTPINMIMSQLVAASSVFSLQLPGDGPIRYLAMGLRQRAWLTERGEVRMGQIHALTMGAIPVLVDWQAESVASLFSGILFRTQVRQETRGGRRTAHQGL